MERKNVGVIAPLPYSMDIGPAISKMREHIKWLSHMHISGLWILGTTAEFPYIPVWWKYEVLRELVPYGKKLGFTVYCGVWDWDPRRAGGLAQTAKEAGADVLFAMTPIFVRASENEMVSYYSQMLEDIAPCSLPFYFYDFPKRSGNQISLRVMQELMIRFPGQIGGIKDSSGDMSRIQDLVRSFDPKEFTVLAGTNTKAREARWVGAHGVVGSLANISPELMYQAWEMYDENAQDILLREAGVIDRYGGPRAINAWLERWGMAGRPGPPHSPLDDYEKEHLFARLRNP